MRITDVESEETRGQVQSHAQDVGPEREGIGGPRCRQHEGKGDQSRTKP